MPLPKHVRVLRNKNVPPSARILPHRVLPLLARDARPNSLTSAQKLQDQDPYLVRKKGEGGGRREHAESRICPSPSRRLPLFSFWHLNVKSLFFWHAFQESEIFLSVDASLRHVRREAGRPPLVMHARSLRMRDVPPRLLPLQRDRRRRVAFGKDP